MSRGTIVGVTTVLFYLVVASVIGLVIFFLAVFVFGRGEQMAPLDPRTSPAELPDHEISSEDVRRIRFALALRGYRMSDVDWTLERLGEQIDELRRENSRLLGPTLDAGSRPEDAVVPAGATGSSPADPTAGPQEGAAVTTAPGSSTATAVLPDRLDQYGAAQHADGQYARAESVDGPSALEHDRQEPVTDDPLPDAHASSAGPRPMFVRHTSSSRFTAGDPTSTDADR